MSDETLPSEISVDYVNDDVELRLTELLAEPTVDKLVELLRSLREGYLFVDITGGKKPSKSRVRTIRSTTGQLVLPLFTSMEQLRGAVASGGRGHGQSEPKGALMPVQGALELIHKDRFVAAQLNPGSEALGIVMLKKFIELVLSDEDITAEAVEARS